MNITIEQLAERMGLSTKTVRRLIQESGMRPDEVRGRQKLYEADITIAALLFGREPKPRRKAPKEVDLVIQEHTQPVDLPEPTLLERVKQLEEAVRQLQKFVGIKTIQIPDEALLPAVAMLQIPDEIIQIFKGIDSNF
jgi:excisionase family DNA binding protein